MSHNIKGKRIYSNESGIYSFLLSKTTRFLFMRKTTFIYKNTTQNRKIMIKYFRINKLLRCNSMNKNQ